MSAATESPRRSSKWRASRQKDGTYRPWTCKRNASPGYVIVIGCGESHASRPEASKHARELNAELAGESA